MSKFVWLFCALVLASSDVFADKIIRVIHPPEGDLAALKAEIEAANELADTHQTTLVLSGDYRFGPADTMPEVISTLSLRGPARLIGGGVGDASQWGDENGPSVLFRVLEGGEFRLDNLELLDFSLNHSEDALIVNQGRLNVQEVQFSGISVAVWCSRILCARYMPLIANGPEAELWMYRASFVDSGVDGDHWMTRGAAGILRNEGRGLVAYSQFYVDEGGWNPLIGNTGELEIRNTSFMNRGDAAAAPPTAFRSANPARLEIVNSVVSGFSTESCSQATSLGYNLNDAKGCDWAAAEDLAGIPAGVIWRRVEANWMYARDRIQKYGIVPMAASPAVDSANQEVCDATSELFTYWPAVENCDRGTFEYVKTTLGEGGINGLYFNPEADGHYVQVLQTDYLTLVIWNTFDLDGNPVWVYGTGQLVDGRSVIAETYVNRGAMVLPDAPVPDAETDYWGTLQLEMTDCQSGDIVFDSVDPNFGSGQFPIERLANVKQLGCVD